jgi:hypothetical protein
MSVFGCQMQQQPNTFSNNLFLQRTSTKITKGKKKKKSIIFRAAAYTEKKYNSKKMSKKLNFKMLLSCFLNNKIEKKYNHPKQCQK